MARVDRRRAAREAARAPRSSRAAGGTRIAEDTMFFPRLRAHARWMFVLLAIVFAGGFVFLGVGSGSGIGDLLSGNWGTLFGNKNPTNSQVDKARKRVKQNPNDPAALKDLATALQTANQPDAAIPPLEKVRKLQPKDTDALTQLAGLYLRKADTARARAAAVQAEAQGSTATSTFQPDPSSQIGKAFQGSADPLTGADPINSAVNNLVSTRSSEAYAKMSDAYKKAVAVYKQLAAQNKTDPAVQFQLAQAAEAAGDTPTAIGAYKAFLKLAPDDPTAPAVKQRLKQLQTPQVQPTVNAGG